MPPAKLGAFQPCACVRGYAECPEQKAGWVMQQYRARVRGLIPWYCIQKKADASLFLRNVAGTGAHRHAVPIQYIGTAPPLVLILINIAGARAKPTPLSAGWGKLQQCALRKNKTSCDTQPSSVSGMGQRYFLTQYRR